MRRTTLAAIAAVCVALVTACGGGGSPSPDPTTTDPEPASQDEQDDEPKELTEVVLGMAGMPPIFLSAVAYVAEDQGFFEDAGLKVTLRPFQTSADVGRAVTTGEIPAGMAGTPIALALRSEGSPTKAIMGFEASSYLVGSADPDVTECEDLKGKTIAVDAIGAPKALGLTTILASCGLTDDDVEMVGVGGTQSPDVMIAKQVDTAVLHPDELAMVQVERETHIVKRITDADPNMHFFTLVASESAIESQRDELVAVVAAFIRAIEFINDPANADAVAQVAGPMAGRSVEVAKAALENYLAIEYWPTDSAGLAENRIKHVTEQQVAVGNIEADAAPTYEEFVDLGIYEEATTFAW